MKQELTIELLKSEAKVFSRKQSEVLSSDLYGVTDGKAVGTYLEHKFQEYLKTKYSYIQGNSAKGIDFPGLGVDMKVTKYTQPQSSCPFKFASQKIYGLGYSLIVFVYNKKDDLENQTGQLIIDHAIFINKERTGHYQTTSGLRKIIKNDGNIGDILAFFEERMLPVGDIEANELAEEVLTNPPLVGYLTISNALQWRLQYSRAIEKAGAVNGVFKIK